MWPLVTQYARIERIISKQNLLDEIVLGFRVTNGVRLVCLFHDHAMLRACAFHAAIDGIETLIRSPADLLLERHVGGALTLIISSKLNDLSPCRIALPSKRQISLATDKLSQKHKVHVHMATGWVVITVLTREEQEVWLTKLQQQPESMSIPISLPTPNRT